MCLATHIDDSPKSYSSTFLNNQILQNTSKQQHQKNKYSTRSLAKKRATSRRNSKAASHQTFREDEDGDDEKEWEDGINIPKYTTSKINGCLGNSTDYVATGLDNLRNTCYMNAVLQCLAGTEQVMRIIGDNTVIAPEGSLYNELKLLLTGITSGEFEMIVPLKFKIKVDEHLGIFAGHRQHDAHDFMCSLRLR